jgi:hypothetical protein
VAITTPHVDLSYVVEAARHATPCICALQSTSSSDEGLIMTTISGAAEETPVAAEAYEGVEDQAEAS